MSDKQLTAVNSSIAKRMGRIGIWSMELRFGDAAQAAEAATELDELGFGALWVPGGVGGNVLGDIDRLLSATQNSIVATGIINIWKNDADEVARWWNAQPADRKARAMLGLGVSHGPLIGDAYQKPLSAMRSYLAHLSTAGVPEENLCIAALGPKMLQLARDRTAGSHPYLVTPEHTSIARAAMGPAALLAPEQAVILETDAVRARALAHKAVAHYARLPNYVNSWKRLGYTDAEISSIDNRLIDGLFAWGGMNKIVERVQAHFAAGADHVCLQVISGAAGQDIGVLRPQWRELAAALL